MSVIKIPETHLSPIIISGKFYESLGKEGMGPGGLIQIERKLAGGETEFIGELWTVYFKSFDDPLIDVHCAVYEITTQIFNRKAHSCDPEFWITDDLNTSLGYQWPHPYHRALLKVRTAPESKVTIDTFTDKALDVFNSVFPEARLNLILSLQNDGN